MCTVFRLQLDSSPTDRSDALSEAEYLKLTVFFHELVKKRVPLNVRLASAIATKHTGTANVAAVGRPLPEGHQRAEAPAVEHDAPLH